MKIGDVVREASMDVLPGFQKPPAGYGNVPFYWWVGDGLTQERIGWQMDQLEACGGITGLQINYAHGYWDGGGFCGLSMPSDPPLFSEAWWTLVSWTMQEAKRRGWSLSLSDYTLGPGQGWVFDKVVQETPGMQGAVLRAERIESPTQGDVWTLPQTLLSVTAVSADGALANLTPLCRDGSLRWEGGDSATTLVVVSVEHPRFSMNPMHPESGRRYADAFFGQFERRFPGEAGKGLNFFFSDELDFKVRGWLWSDDFAAEFLKRKGYDVRPELALLFVDGNARAPKIRLDYADVMVQLSEERFFKPVFDWHETRGMIYGCDHGGRGRDVTEFGDYFRTQRWNQGPGCDQAYGECNLIKNKVASSIAHLYLRPRVWLEGFHSTGWGFSSDRLTTMTFRNFAQGQNLLSLHGLYYTTHGGFWEWAPPCNHFRMPYWKHSKVFFDMLQRISYLLAQGHHRCDVAVLYPVASVEGQLNNTDSVTAAFGLGEALYARQVDFDFMDFESLDRAEIDGDTLIVSGEIYRVLVLPSMKVIRWSTLTKALAFHRAGGKVAMLGDMPEASDRIGAEDSELRQAVMELSAQGAHVFQNAGALCQWIAASGVPDFSLDDGIASPVDFMHRRIGERDVYFVYGVPGGTTCCFRVSGKVERWDVWSGTTESIPVLEQTTTTTRLRLPDSGVEAQVIVFSPGSADVVGQNLAPRIERRISVDAIWTVCLVPTLDNRFGDFRLPARQEFMGAAVQRAFVCETSPDASLLDARAAFWTEQTFGFAPKYQITGPCDPCDRWRAPAQTEKLSFVDYPFSWRWGIEGDPGKQGFHGLKEQISDDFLVIGEKGEDRGIRTYDFEYQATPGCVQYARAEFELARPERVRLCVGGVMPNFIWIDAMRYDVDAGAFTLEAGVHRLLLQYSNAGRGHCVVLRADSVADGGTNAESLSMRWYRESGRIPLGVPGSGGKVRWYRFRVPSGAQSIRFEADGVPEVYVNDRLLDCAVEDEKFFHVALPPKTEEVILRMPLPGEICGPIDVACGAWTMTLGDWGKTPALESYSGGMTYRATVSVSAEMRNTISALDLGTVGCSAEVCINGVSAGVRVASPWRVNVAGLLKTGENTVEITVYNTLANYYRRIPTAFNANPPASGLLGPVQWVCSGDNYVSINGECQVLTSDSQRVSRN